MAHKRDGSMSIQKCLWELSKLIGDHGIPARLAAAYPGLAAALGTLNAILAVAKGLDDNPLVVDLGLPAGPEDDTGGASEGPFSV